jgi:hypothetical protein
MQNHISSRARLSNGKYLYVLHREEATIFQAIGSD